MTYPVFVVGSGRSGSELVARLLAQYNDVRSHHEYMIHTMQPLACKWQMQLIPNQEVKKAILDVYHRAVSFEDRRLWVNSCNKASWLVKQIDWVFKGQARFVFLARNGRRVVSSYYYKLSDECYKHQDVEALREWVYGNTGRPPNEKRYWWPIPPDDFSQYDRFMRICWHWATIVSEINNQLAEVDPKRTLTLRLEDFVSNPMTFKLFLDFMGLELREDLFEQVQVPVNVREPKSYNLTNEQEQTFEKFCEKQNRLLGYSGDYNVNYTDEGTNLKIFTY